MSDLQRSFAKAKLASLPTEPPPPPNAFIERNEFDEEDTDELQALPDSEQDEDSSSASSASSASSTGTIRPNKLLKVLPDCGVFSVDARGHGETVVKSPDGEIKGTPYDLSLDMLSLDLTNTVKLLQARLAWPQLPNIVLVGHSLGGPIVTDVARKGTLGSSILGYAVLDVVEGSAMEALQKMNLYLATRPKTFQSVTAGIEWQKQHPVPDFAQQYLRTYLSAGPWMWRTDLSATEHYWENWFTGLSKKFLEAKGGKLLILAGTDRLDKELMIGQMQGKYQLQVFPEAGHFIHEDQPARTAMVLADFYRRNDQSALVLPPKVGEMLKQRH
ncbi:MAG: hypothetical protein Q9206_000246 [Seirophora lacunosa]